jgi:hypothetical protein
VPRRLVPLQVRALTFSLSSNRQGCCWPCMAGRRCSATYYLRRDGFAIGAQALVASLRMPAAMITSAPTTARAGSRRRRYARSPQPRLVARIDQCRSRGRDALLRPASITTY